MAKQNATTGNGTNKGAKSQVIPDVHASSLEDIKSTEKKAEHVDPDNFKWLQENNFLDHVNPKDKNVVSSKYDEEREKKVQNGLILIAKLFPDVDPELLLLGKWWENKAVRASIKTKIDKTAQENGIDPVVYMQTNLRDQVDPMKDLVSAIERISYCITYFKPREGAANKKTKQMNIGGEIYEVPLLKAEELKKTYAGDLETYKEEILKIATKVTVEEL